MSELEFEYPDDFKDDVEDEILPEPTPFKASHILYASSVAFWFSGVILILGDILARPRDGQFDTFIELLEWNPFSQAGAIGIVLGLFMFWLGLMVDRRGA